MRAGAVNMFGRAHSRVWTTKLALAGVAASLSVAVVHPARSQQPVEDFYRGRQLEMIIGYSPGGTYDLYARLVARFLGNYIPGKPTIVPPTMPAAATPPPPKSIHTIGPMHTPILP